MHATMSVQVSLLACPIAMLRVIAHAPGSKRRHNRPTVLPFKHCVPFLCREVRPPYSFQKKLLCSHISKMGEEEQPKPVEWNERLERLMAEEGEKCRGLAWLHERAEKKYSRWNTYIALPVIVLSTVGGFLSASTGSILPQDTTTSGMLGGLSVFVGVLNTVGSYFSWAKRSEGHKVANLTYAKLYRFISIEMSLPRSQRMRAPEFLKTVREQIDRLGELSPVVPPDTIAEFNKHFYTVSGIKKPEVTNGLEKIEIYSDEAIPVLIPGSEAETRIKVSVVDPTPPAPKLSKTARHVPTSVSV